MLLREIERTVRSLEREEKNQGKKFAKEKTADNNISEDKNIQHNSRWGTPKKVTADGSSTSGTIRAFGLDCSGYVDWVFNNAHGYVIGHGGGAASQHTYCTNISWNEAQIGDLVFYPDDSHVGIVCGFDENGDVLIVHCASGYNNVVITSKEGFTSVGRPDFYEEAALDGAA